MNRIMASVRKMVKSAKTAFEVNAAKYLTGLTGIATGNVKVFLICFWVFFKDVIIFKKTFDII